MKKYVRYVEADALGPILRRLRDVSSSSANAKSDAESQRDGRSPKTRLVASPEKVKLDRKFFTYCD